jgi:hypothetical protein
MQQKKFSCLSVSWVTNLHKSRARRTEGLVDYDRFVALTEQGVQVVNTLHLDDVDFWTDHTEEQYVAQIVASVLPVAETDEYKQLAQTLGMSFSALL